MAISASNIDIDDWIAIFEEYLEIKNEMRSNSAELISVAKQNIECAEFCNIQDIRFNSREKRLQNRKKDYSESPDSKKSACAFQSMGEMKNLSLLKNSRHTARNEISDVLAKPKVKIFNRGRLKHSVEFWKDNSGSKHIADIKGCEIWYKIEGSESAEESGFEYLSTDTKSPHIIHFRKEFSGKTVTYRLRWVNSRNETGPWSETQKEKIRLIPNIRIRPEIIILIFQKLIM